ncbi:MAG TPA: CDP-alcohol phosphatidyltransferase family protein [Thermoanaerobaculia bacterium]|jgi:phosphatidylglycerophosphate synthase
MAERRPLKSRDRAWAKTLASTLVRLRVRPNVISLFSIVFAGVAATGFLLSARSSDNRLLWLLLAAAGIQLRLLCNLFDGMVAVEGKMASKTGEIYNDFPDRIADPLIIVSAGYAVGCATLGWAAGLLAVMTAYVRVLGGSMGVPQDFRGPMAKPHRMALLTVAAIADGLVTVWILYRPLFIALALIVLGTIVTMIRRTARIARELNAR